MRLKIQPITPVRTTYLLVQLLTASFIILLARTIYFQHHYYKGFLGDDSKSLLGILLWVLLLLIFLDTLRNFLFVKDIGPTKLTLIFGLWIKLIHNFSQFMSGGKKYTKITIDAKTKTALLSLLVKFFYIPIMVTFVISNYQGIQVSIRNIYNGNFNFDIAYVLIVNALFTLDTLIFTFGYFIEADFLRNRIRSVEPTFLGWAVALSTYPPFNSVPGMFFSMPQGGFTFLAQNVYTFYILRILILICHFIFVASSVALGFKGSNLTNRGIVARGPYAIVRHPAYTVKLLSWFMDGLLFAASGAYFVGWLGFAFIYFMRAITEERHLSMDPDYVEYKKQVKYKFIPGVV